MRRLDRRAVPPRPGAVRDGARRRHRGAGGGPGLRRGGQALGPGTREAVRALGLPPERLLLAGVYGGAIPDAGPLFEAVVRAVTLVMWARDCNVICAPWPGSGPAGQSATFTVAAAVAQTSGVGLLAVAPSDEAPLPPVGSAVRHHRPDGGQAGGDRRPCVAARGPLRRRCTCRLRFSTTHHAKGNRPEPRLQRPPRGPMRAAIAGREHSVCSRACSPEPYETRGARSPMPRLDTTNPSAPSGPSSRSLRGLDAINLLMADVRDGVGPYLSVFLKGGEHWDAGAIGIAMAASSIAAAVCQVPAGLLVDGAAGKRLLIAASGLMVGAGCLLIVLVPAFPDGRRGAGDAGRGLGGDPAGHRGAVARPGRAAAARRADQPQRELQPRRQLRRRRAGRACSASISATTGSSISSAPSRSRAPSSSRSSTRPRSTMSAPAAARMRPTAASRSPLRDLLRRRDLLIFLASVVLFHFGNAAMLPMAGQVLAHRPSRQRHDRAVGLHHRGAARHGRRRLGGGPGIGARASAASRSSWWRSRSCRCAACCSRSPPARTRVVAIQLLDGVAAGIFGVISVLIAVRPHARHRAVQPGPGADGARRRHRRGAEQRDRRLSSCSGSATPAGLPVPRGHRRLRAGVLRPAHAGNAPGRRHGAQRPSRGRTPHDARRCQPPLGDLGHRRARHRRGHRPPVLLARVRLGGRGRGAAGRARPAVRRGRAGRRRARAPTSICSSPA